MVVYTTKLKVTVLPTIYKKNISSNNLNSSVELKEMMREIITKVKRNTNEMRELRDEIKIKKGKWEREKTKLLTRVAKLEETVEKHEKEKRKNNIVITGIKEQNINKNSVQTFITEKLGFNAIIKSAYAITKNKEIVIVEVESFEKKLDILKNKYKLKGSRIYILKMT